MKISNNPLINDISKHIINDINLEGLNITIPEITNWKTFFQKTKIKPNEKCFCGSQIKYKKCCRLKIINNNDFIKAENEYINALKTAANLYNKCYQAKLTLINPQEYLDKQNINRLFFEKLNTELLKQNNSELFNDISFKYLKFMYENFPAGMGDYIVKKRLTKQKINMAEVYYNYKYNTF